MKRTTTWILLFFLFPILASHAQDAFEVPKSKVIRNINGVDYYIHTVARGQSVYKISKTYGISAEDLIRLNPEISDGLRINQELRIPAGKEKMPLPGASPAPERPALSEEKPCGSDPSAKKGTYDVALMMHFFLGDVDTLDMDNPPDDPAQVYRPFQFIQFYEGFLIAVDSLKKTGLSIRLHIYDVSSDTSKTRKFLEDPELKKMDLMIGLMYHLNFQIVAEFAAMNKIPLVSPVSERESQVINNPMVIKVRPSSKSLVPKVAEMISKQYPDANVVIVRNPQSRFRDAADQLQKLCNAGGVKAVVTESNTMTDQLQKEPLNIIAIFSENKSAILDLLTQLNGIKTQYRISVYGLPNWDRIDGLEVDYLVSLKTHMVAPYFIDYDNENVKKFVRVFQENIKTDPDPLAFTGFDVAEYFLTALMKYGTAFPKCMNEFNPDLLEAKYEFGKTETGGYENQHWMVYYYENFRVYDAMND
jgi:LysM repeat protein